MFKVIGTKEENISFDDFKKEKVFIYFDFPRLILMSSPDDEKWIFSWLCNDELEKEEENEIINRWIAFKISDNRLKEIESGDISLRELILLCETFEEEYLQFYIFDSVGMFDIKEVWSITPELIPEEYLPKDDIPIIKQRVEKSLPCFQQGKLNLDIHFFPEISQPGEIPLALLGPFQENLQNYITRSASNLAPREHLAEIYNWTPINACDFAAGSVHLYCVSIENEVEKVEILEECCEILKVLCDGKYPIDKLEKFESKIGEKAFTPLKMFLYHIIENNISVNLKWNYSNDRKWKSLILNKRKAQKVLDFMDEYKSEENKRYEESIRIVIKLTQSEADDIRKPAPTSGGFQGLFEKLQMNLDDNNILTLHIEDLERIVRYALEYGKGGYQQRLFGIINALERMKISIRGLR